MDIQLNYWRKATNTADLERLYVNPATDARGQSLGYFEFKTLVRPIDPHSSSYYERHRWCKGEDQVHTALAPEWKGEADLRDRVLVAVLGETGPACFDSDPHDTWLRLRERARGFRYTVIGASSRDAETRKKARAIAAANRKRDWLVFKMT